MTAALAIVHDHAAAQQAPAGSGSRILTAWRADRERERRAAAVERERAQALAALRRHGARAAPRRLAPAAEMQPVPQPAFPVVDGAPASAASERAFQAAAADRLTAGWPSHTTGINADLDAALVQLRARSRDWTMNADTGRRYLDMVRDNVVGPEGPRLQMRAKLSSGEMDEAANAAVEQAWWRWCHRGSCEVTGQLSFADVCRLVIAAAARDGEYLVRRIRDRRLPMGYQLQVLDVDRILTGSMGAAQAQGRNTVRLGVEIDTLGRPVALHLHNEHPGDRGHALAPKPVADRVLMDQVFHGFMLERPEQVRGYPWTAAVLLGAHQLAQFKQYALVAAKYGAAKMGFYVTDKDAPSGDAPSFEEYKQATGELVQDVEAGLLEALPPGTDFKTFDPAYPHQAFESFVTGHERSQAAGLNVAHHNLSGNMTGVNFSSARIAELSERAHWRAVQRWFVDSFVRPVFEEWLGTALLTGSIALPSGARLPSDRHDKFAAAATFQCRSWAWVDPDKDLKAAERAIGNQLRSVRQVTDEQGVDLEEVLADNAQFVRRMQELGIPLPAWAGGPRPADEPAADEPAANEPEVSTA